MFGQGISSEVRQAARVHARLLDRFIELVQAELDRQPPTFVEESLREYLEEMRQARKSYGALAGLVAIENAA